MERELTIAEATESFAELVAWARQYGQSVRVTEKGQVVASIVPAKIPARVRTVAESLKIWNDPARPRLSPDEADAFEADIKEGLKVLLPPKEDPWE